MDNVRTRKNSTYLYQDSDPVEGQFMWVKSERSNWQKNKIIKVLDKKTVSEGEEFMMEMSEFPGKVITIMKFPNKSIRPKQEIYGWTRCPTEDEQQAEDLWEDDFEEANNDDGHELNIYRNIFEEDTEPTNYSKNKGIIKGILKQGNRNNNSEQDNEKDDKGVENEESDARTLEVSVDLPSFASGISVHNNINYLIYSTTCIGGIYVKDGMLSITHASEDKQLLCRHDDWIDLLNMEYGIIMLTDSIIQQIARQNGQIQSGLIKEWQDLSAKYWKKRKAIIPIIEDKMKNNLIAVSTEENDQDLTMIEVTTAINNYLNSKIKEKKDLSKILGQSYKENGKREKQIMQRLLDGKDLG